MEALLPVLAGDGLSAGFTKPVFNVILRATVEATLSFMGEDGTMFGVTPAQGTVVFGEYVDEAAPSDEGSVEAVRPPVILLALHGEPVSATDDLPASQNPAVSQLAPLDHAIRVFTPRTLENVAYCE